MREPIDDDIDRLARVLDMPARDRKAVIREAIRRLASDDPVQDVKRVGRVLGTSYKDMNERDIARIDATRTVEAGDTYVSRGKTVVAKKTWTKTTRGFRVQFRHAGRMYWKFFSDSKHGGPFGARAAARKWRDETEREIGRNVTNVRVAVQTFNR